MNKTDPCVTTASEETRLESINGRIDEVKTSLINAACEIMVFVDNADGEHPRSAPGLQDKPNRCGRVGSIEDALDQLFYARDEVFDAIRVYRELNL